MQTEPSVNVDKADTACQRILRFFPRKAFGDFKQGFFWDSGTVIQNLYAKIVSIPFRGNQDGNRSAAGLTAVLDGILHQWLQGKCRYRNILRVLSDRKII